MSLVGLAPTLDLFTSYGKTISFVHEHGNHSSDDGLIGRAKLLLSRDTPQKHPNSRWTATRVVAPASPLMPVGSSCCPTPSGRCRGVKSIPVMKDSTDYLNLLTLPSLPPGAIVTRLPIVSTWVGTRQTPIFRDDPNLVELPRFMMWRRCMT